mmetsp:Transcript_34077/g.82417  ORF Transcript_34077/g.82417 Transcript_34077/m.82417 type:complete len:1316 (-) Transcript_34077:356-4303(-)
MSFPTKKSNDGDQRRRGNFNSVPADDGFRNYMARKIELQRKQFGLVVPPPPPPSPPPKHTPPKILKNTTLAKINGYGCGDPNFSTLTNTPVSSNTIATPSASGKKSVRFNQHLEIEGVSQVLNSLKQRHTYSGRKKISRSSSAHKRRRKSRGPTFDEIEQSLTKDTAPKESLHDHLSTEEEYGDHSNSFNSVLGVLDNLQKRHGTSSSKKKRSQYVSHSSRKRRDNHRVGDHEISFLESINNAPEDRSDDVGSSSPMSMYIRESPILKAGPVLEGLNPTIHDSTIQQYEPRENDCLDQERYQQQSWPRSESPSVEPHKLVLTQLTYPSPAVKSPSVRDSRDPRKLQDYQSELLESNASESLTSLSPMVQTTKPLPMVDTSLKSARKRSPRPDLFLSGVVVLVNGHTSPDSTTLMRLLHKHGGDLEKYETSRVTHIIAEQLSVAKANVYKRQKKPLPVCRPEWITCSVESGKLLPFGNYLLEDVKDTIATGTKSVKSFFSTNPNCTNASSAIGGDDNIGSAESHNGPTEEGNVELFSNKGSSSISGSQRWQDSHPSKSNYELNGKVRTVGNDPNFLESYFNNSRLSYIGSFKQRVKPNSKAASRSQIKIGARKFVLLVDMDCFFASVALKKYPQYRSKPVAVGHSHVERSRANENASTTKKQSQNSSSELSTCNYIARKHGIRKGMFLGDAIQLCPDLVVLPYDFEGFEEVSGIVADQLHEYAEQYNGCVETVSCDESYVQINLSPEDCAGANCIYDFVNSLAEHIRADIVKKTECTASIGIGPNKLLAKLAADRVKPNACCVVKDWRDFLDNRDLRDIPGVGRKSRNKLQAHGLGTVNDIWDLGEEAEHMLGEIIGQGNAHKVVQYCYGNDERPVTPLMRKSIGAECNYGVRFDGPYGVDYFLSGLAKELQKRMSRACVRGSKLVLKIMKSKDTSKVPGKFLGHGLCDSFSRSADISLTRDESIISSVSMKLYKNLAVDESFDKRAVRGMGIVINSLKYDNEANSLSPSKLSAWLTKDVTETKGMSNNATDEAGTSKQLTYAAKEKDPFMETALGHPVTDNSIPTYSQLDQEVLQNLPEDILLEVKSAYGKNSSIPTSSTSQSPPKSSKTKYPGKFDYCERSIPIPGQTSVRRMLKLACFKSGEEQLGGNDVSLSQFDSLPMEVQLQIANGDDVKIAKRPKHEMEQTSKSLKLASDLSDPTEVEILSVRSPQIGNQENCSLEDMSTNFYHENIAPLCEFISSNPYPDSNTIDAVQDFLSLCIHERRIDDVVTFLRKIKNMRDGWGSEIYVQLRKSTVKNIYSTIGSILDVRWLGL